MTLVHVLKMIRKKRFMECLGWFLLGFIIHWILDLRKVIVFEDHTVPLEAREQFETATTIKSTSMTKKKKKYKYHRSSHETQSSTNTTNKAIEFVLFVGLEGTGHHFMTALLQNSPMKQRLLRLGLKDYKSGILSKLFDKNLDGRGDTGLWDAHCNHIYKPIDTLRIKEKVASKLRRAHSHVLKANKKNQDQPKVIFPINTLWSEPGFGMLSYPNFGGWGEYGCRFLSYPNLDLWYDVCDNLVPEVECSHILLYRDPIQILHSTVNKRHFNPNLLMSVHLYTTMLHIIISQLSAYKHKTIGCYGFYEYDYRNQSWFDNVRDLFWDGRTKNTYTEYETFIDSIYRPPTPITFQDLFNWNKTTSSDLGISNVDKLESYMKHLMDLHQRQIEICSQGLNTTTR